MKSDIEIAQEARMLPIKEVAKSYGCLLYTSMLEDARRSPVRQFNLASSCVPSVPGLEGSGASFGPEEIAMLLDREGVVGIAEVMDVLSVVNDAQRMHGILAEGLRRDVLIQGHAPRVYGKELAAYILGGPTDNTSKMCIRDSL